MKEKSVVDKVKEGNRQQEIDLERLSKDLSMAKVHAYMQLTTTIKLYCMCVRKV